MRRLLSLQTAFIVLAACPLAAGCVGASLEPAIGASVSRLDAEGALSIELAYQAAALAVVSRVADDAGTIDLAEVKRRDQVAFDSVRDVRAALRSGDAIAYRNAQHASRRAIEKLLAL